MSRSYKKNPWVNNHKRKSTKENKQIANRRVRRMNKNLDWAQSASYYKRQTDSWDITDYCWRWTREEARQEYECGKLSNYIYSEYPTVADWLNYWEKCCYRK